MSASKIEILAGIDMLASKCRTKELDQLGRDLVALYDAHSNGKTMVFTEVPEADEAPAHDPATPQGIHPGVDVAPVVMLEVAPEVPEAQTYLRQQPTLVLQMKAVNLMALNQDQAHDLTLGLLGQLARFGETEIHQVEVNEDGSATVVLLLLTSPNLGQNQVVSMPVPFLGTLVIVEGTGGSIAVEVEGPAPDAVAHADADEYDDEYDDVDLDEDLDAEDDDEYDDAEDEPAGPETYRVVYMRHDGPLTRDQAAAVIASPASAYGLGLMGLNPVPHEIVDVELPEHLVAAGVDPAKFKAAVFHLADPVADDAETYRHRRGARYTGDMPFAGLGLVTANPDLGLANV